MSKRAIVVVGNCVMPWLMDALSAFDDLARRFDIVGPRVTLLVHSIEALVLQEEPAELRNCALLLVQERIHGTFTLTPTLLNRLPPDCVVIKLPTITFTSLWPLVCNDPRNTADAAHPWGNYPLSRSDRLALDVMRNESLAANRRERYLLTRLSSVVDVGRIHEVQSAQLIAAEQNCDVKIAAYVLTRFRKERLFYAHHHPTAVLLGHVMAQLFALPAFEPFRTGSVDRMTRDVCAWLESKNPFAEEQVPIHPEVARHFGLEWCSPGMIYEIDGKKLTFDQWLDVYMSEPLP